MPEAIAAFLAAKEREAKANADRLAAEASIVALMGPLPAEGTTRIDADGFTVAVATSMRRTVDAEALSQIAPKIPEAIGKRLLRWKPELVLRELRYLQDNEPELYAVIAEAITTAPAKPAVRVEPIKEAA
jgi:hypothetical protein